MIFACDYRPDIGKLTLNIDRHDSLNDVEFSTGNLIKVLKEEMEKHPRLGILYPSAEHWGEKLLLKPDETKYFGYVQLLS